MDVQPILGASTLIKKNIVQINVNQLSDDKRQNGLLSTIQKHEKVFCGLGKIGDKCSFKLDKNIIPKIHAPRRVPFALKEPLQEKLNEMVKMGVIKKVNCPTEWVSSTVIVKKPDNTIRVCLDPTDLNKAIIRPIYPLPTIEEVIPQLHNAKYFSILDAKNGYW